MGRFWYSSSPFRVRALVFKSLVYETAISAWVAVAPSLGDCSGLDAALLQHIRRLWRGEACQKALMKTKHNTLDTLQTQNFVIRQLYPSLF